MRGTRGLVGIVVLAVVGSMPIEAGQAGTWAAPGASQDRPSDPNRRQEAPDASRVRLQEEQAKKMNDERQRRLEGDSAKLYELAGELKEQVAKSDKNTLSVDVVKKADEIERLAKSVKDKMRG